MRTNATQDSWYSGRRVRPGAKTSGGLLSIFINVAPWMADGLCSQNDPEAFYPNKGGSTREAKAVCRRCPVAAECLAYALANEERYGIWGGLSERERRRVKKDQGPRPCQLDECNALIPIESHGSTRYCTTAHQLLAQAQRADQKRATA